MLIAQHPHSPTLAIPGPRPPSPLPRPLACPPPCPVLLSPQLVRLRRKVAARRGAVTRRTAPTRRGAAARRGAPTRRGAAASRGAPTRRGAPLLSYLSLARRRLSRPGIASSPLTCLRLLLNRLLKRVLIAARLGLPLRQPKAPPWPPPAGPARATRHQSPPRRALRRTTPASFPADLELILGTSSPSVRASASSTLCKCSLVPHRCMACSI